MDSLIQIVYISRSSFIPTIATTGIEPNVARILAKSRSNNKKNGLVGVLYFGDGCFFQCLQGKESEIDRLYAKLQLDSRHHDLKLLSREKIIALSFSDWAMKYVLLEKKLNIVLQSNGYSSFDPYKFDAPMIDKVLHLLQTSSNATSEDVVIPHISKVANKQFKDPLAKLALIISILSFIVSIYALSHGA